MELLYSILASTVFLLNVHWHSRLWLQPVILFVVSYVSKVYKLKENIKGCKKCKGKVKDIGDGTGPKS